MLSKLMVLTQPAAVSAVSRLASLTGNLAFLASPGGLPKPPGRKAKGCAKASATGLQSLESSSLGDQTKEGRALLFTAAFLGALDRLLELRTGPEVHETSTLIQPA